MISPIDDSFTKAADAEPIQLTLHNKADVLRSLGGYGAVHLLTIDKVRELRRVEKRQVLPERSAVRFLARREVMPSHSSSIFGSKMRDGALRVAVQAHIDTEVGAMVLPTPVLEQYEPYQAAQHGQPPEVETGYHNPMMNMISSLFTDNETMPYWSITEVEVRL